MQLDDWKRQRERWVVMGKASTEGGARSKARESAVGHLEIRNEKTTSSPRLGYHYVRGEYSPRWHQGLHRLLGNGSHAPQDAWMPQRTQEQQTQAAGN